MHREGYRGKAAAACRTCGQEGCPRDNWLTAEELEAAVMPEPVVLRLPARGRRHERLGGGPSLLPVLASCARAIWARASARTREEDEA